MEFFEQSNLRGFGKFRRAKKLCAQSRKRLAVCVRGHPSGGLGRKDECGLAPRVEDLEHADGNRPSRDGEMWQ